LLVIIAVLTDYFLVPVGKRGNMRRRNDLTREGRREGRASAFSFFHVLIVGEKEAPRAAASRERIRRSSDLAPPRLGASSLQTY
jgi:hypothetical protein